MSRESFTGCQLEADEDIPAGKLHSDKLSRLSDNSR